jgi:hypothetical protein
MPISVPGILLSKFALDQEPIPDERRKQLMLVGGAAPFPLGVVIAQLVAKREAETPANVVSTDTGSTDRTASKEAAAAEATREAIAARQAAEQARDSAEATQEAADNAARAAKAADEAAQHAAQVVRALNEEWAEEEEAARKQS